MTPAGAGVRPGAQRLAVVGLVLLFGLLLGLTHEPDSGTAASVGAPDIAAATVGSNHAKPLPAVRTVQSLLALWQVLEPALVALVLVAPRPGGAVHARPDDERRPSVAWSLARTGRGPPALA